MFTHAVNVVLLWEQERWFRLMTGRWPISSSGLRNTTSQTSSSSTNLLLHLQPNDYDLGVMYRVGEFVVLQDSLSERREWVMEISSIIVYGPIANKYKTFVDGNYFAART